MTRRIALALATVLATLAALAAAPAANAASHPHDWWFHHRHHAAVQAHADGLNPIPVGRTVGMRRTVGQITDYSVIVAYCGGAGEPNETDYYRTRQDATQSYSNNVQRMDHGDPILLVMELDDSQAKSVLAVAGGYCPPR